MRVSALGLDDLGNRAVLTASASAASIPELFAEQVARVPEAVAVCCGDRSLSYRELDEAANRLAHVLAGLGAGPGQCVALLFDRSVEAIMAILAVLKSGAAYLPIDPAHPDARVEFMLADAAPIAALSTAGLAERLSGCGAAGDRRDRSRGSTALPGRRCRWRRRLDDIAYVIYTSGTTGTPKGVAITHRQRDAAAGVGWIRRWRALVGCGRSGTRWCSTCRCGRSSVRCCTAGGWWWCPRTVARSPQDLHALLVAERVGVLSQTPSAAGALLGAGLGVGGVGGRR